MSNYSQLVALVRRKVGFPEPEAGGDDKLSNAVIIEYLNDAYDQMCDAIFGFNRYVEFTITALGVIAVTDPTTNPPAVAVTADPAGGSYPVYTIDDARSYEGVENKTVAIIDDPSRIMVRRSLNAPGMQGTYNSTVQWLKYYDILGSRGFSMLPLTITATNTIGITYRRIFIRYAIGDIAFTGVGLDDMTQAGIYTENDGATNNYRVEIDGNAPDTFTWSNDGGATWEAAGVAVDTDPVTLENGLTVTFGALLGHTIGERWDWAATAPLLTEMTESEQRRFPVLRSAAECACDLDDTRHVAWLALAEGRYYPEREGGLLLDFINGRGTEDITADLNLDF